MSPCCCGVITQDIWRHRILYYCDLVTLIRLAMTNRFLRSVMNQPQFVVQWQDQCWYLYRDCKCDRNLFYLDTQQYCDFLWEEASNPEITRSMMAVDYHLRDHGRSVAMLMQTPPYRGLERMPALYPQDRREYALGICSVYLDELIVPMPRMLPVPVEYAAANQQGAEQMTQYYQRLHPEIWGVGLDLPVNQAGVFESEEAFHYRCFWRDVHPIPYYLPHHGSTTVCGSVPPSSWPEVLEPDVLQQYVVSRRAQQRDPYDPNDDDDCEGHRAMQWVRHKLYETGVGNQQYPHDLCLHKDELCPRMAQLRGVDYLERLYVSLHRWDHASSIIYDHRGVVYTHTVRYNNEKGDFVPWALNTLALQHSMYMRLWAETMQRFVSQCGNFARNVAMQVEEAIPAHRMLCRLRELAHVVVDGPIPANDWLEAMTDIHRKLFLTQARHHSLLQLMQRRLEAFEYQGMMSGAMLRYLSDLVPNIRPEDIHAVMANQTAPFPQLIMDVYRTMDVMAFVVDFSLFMGPLEHKTTVGFRRTSMRIYLQWGLSLLMFNPVWKTDYDVKPSRAHILGPIRVPRVDLSHNHRFQEYMEFLNHRILYHKPEWTAGYLPHKLSSDLNRRCTGPV